MVERTAYSVTANPTLFFWIHIIGCFLGEERSMRARYVSPKDIVRTFESAAAFALSSTSASDYSRIFTSTREQAAQIIKDNEESEEVDKLALQLVARSTIFEIVIW
ncbi:hypothetical protein JTE90_005788 [Oedothorax gibbosus]|uniref:Rhabdovirus nucleocapsid domain-containing protein n=1 Tax=Oedothorax gibbosus TaxID=931172 RepID=A0AAV6TFE7_9ARAC|nr:hypothetical protein JTE90_005788 [Oedothorax gibbosus]